LRVGAFEVLDPDRHPGQCGAERDHRASPTLRVGGFAGFCQRRSQIAYAKTRGARRLPAHRFTALCQALARRPARRPG
jgi:hypothetical protein